jgi:hypothetical protein
MSVGDDMSARAPRPRQRQVSGWRNPALTVTKKLEPIIRS